MNRGPTSADPGRCGTRESLLLAGGTLIRYRRLWRALLAPGRGRLIAARDMHDATLADWRALLRCDQPGAGAPAPGPRAPVMLLVVPGRRWEAPDVSRLRAWEAAGHGLAARGCDHRAARVRGP